MIAKSDRISLRYAKPDDAKALFSYTGDLDSSRYLARKPHSSPEQTLKMLTRLSTKESIVLYGKCVWVIYLDQINSPIGIITLVKEGSDIEIHFGMIIDFTSQGFASEAISLAACYCSSKIGNKVISFADQQNLAAQTALIKSGFECTGGKEDFYTAPQLSNDKRSVFSYVYSA